MNVRPRCENDRCVIFRKDSGIIVQNLTRVPVIGIINIVPFSDAFPMPFTLVSLQDTKPCCSGFLGDTCDCRLDQISSLWVQYNDFAVRMGQTVTEGNKRKPSIFQVSVNNWGNVMK